MLRALYAPKAARRSSCGRSCRMRVLVVGAGLGGLLLNILLKRQGLDSTVVERASDHGRGGYVLALWQVGLRALEKAGLGAKVNEAGRVVHAYAVADDRGRVRREMSLRRLNERHGALVQLHRRDLHEILRNTPENDDLRMGTCVTALEEDAGGVTVRFDDGTSDRYDVVVGADGIRSSVRRMAFPDHASPSPFGAVGWSFLAPADPTTPEGIVELWGRGKYVGVYRYAKDVCGVYGAIRDPGAGSSAPESRRIDLLKRSFVDFRSYIPRLFENLPEDEAIFHDVLGEVKIPRWTTNGVALLGDAAHAMLPFGGMGASMAFEDAVVLAEHLTAARPSDGGVAMALRRYERRRRWRVRPIQFNAWLKGLTMFRGDRVPLGLRTASAICRDPLMQYDSYQERVLDGFLASSP